MRKSLAVLALAFSSLSSAAFAQEYLTLGAGTYDVFDENIANFSAEYRGAPFWHGLLPIVGVQMNVDGDIYGYAGLNYDWAITQNFYLTPTAAVGGYHHNAGVDLGGGVEFRTGLEASYRFDNNHRAGLAFHHLSNASLYDNNPGAEQVMFTYSIPVSVFK